MPMRLFIFVSLVISCMKLAEARQSGNFGKLLLVPTNPNAYKSASESFTRLVSSEEQYSSSLCFGGTPRWDGWRTTTCVVKRACFDRATKEFVYYAAPDDPGPKSTSMGIFNTKWGPNYDASVRHTFRLAREPIPSEALRTKDWRGTNSPKQLYIPHTPFAPSNIGHLIWDDFETWFTAAWHVAEWNTPTELRPVWWNPRSRPPWATCDWIRMHSGPGHSLSESFPRRCLSNQRRWLEMILGPGNVVEIPETNSTFVAFQEEKSDLVCFNEMVVGLGSLSNQGSGLHGWLKDDSIPPSAGRGPLFWEFRSHAMRMLGAAEPEPGSIREIIVFFSLHSSDRVRLDFGLYVSKLNSVLPELELALQRRYDSKIKLRVIQAKLADMSSKEQAELAAKTAIFLTVAGGGAFTAQFLSRGASIILFHKDDEQIHDGFVDFKVWNFATPWLRAEWILLDSKLEHKADLDRFLDLIRREVDLCVHFMDILSM